MKALLAITGRELRERWTLVFAALAVGLGPLLPFVQPSKLAAAAAMVGPAALVIALLTGASVIARDLADGRLAFFFARPVPWWAIAGGKLLAALVLTVAAAAVAATPAMLIEWGVSGYAGWIRGLMTSGASAVLVLLALGLIGLGHAASVVYRSRSPWAALDLALFAGAIAGGVALVRALVRWGLWGVPPPTGRWWVGVFLLFAAVALAPAAVQVARGRTDIRRGHAALSLTLWSGVLVMFAIGGGLLAGELAVAPAELRTRQVASAGRDGRFVALLGSRGSPDQGRPASFLMDTASGRYVRHAATSGPNFAADGRYAVWVEEPPFWHSLVNEVQLARLGGPGPLVEPVELLSPLPRERVLGFALSHLSDRVAVVQTHTLSVYELPTGRTLNRNAAADGDWIAAAFLSDGRLRAFRRVRAGAGGSGRETLSGHIEIVEVRSGVPSSGVRLEAVGHAILLSAPDADRVLLHEPQAPPRVSVHDARSGRRLQAFSGEPGFPVSDALLLGNGLVAVVESDRVSSRLRLWSEGQPDRVVALPAGFAVLGGELPGGLLAVGLRLAGGSAGRPRGPDAVATLFLALDSGEPRGREPGLLPALRRTALSPHLGSLAASQLFASESGELVRLDPATGERRVILAATRAPTPADGSVPGHHDSTARPGIQEK